MFQIRDHSLGSFFNRWLVFIDEIREPVTPDLLGYLCVIGTEDGHILLKQLQPGRTAGRYDLISEFGTTFRDVSVTWAAKVRIILPP